MLTVHHLGKSQSERVVWLCEELGIPYDLRVYARDPVTMLAPPEYKVLHPLGAAPVITDGDVVLAESGAIVEYITQKHGGGRLTLPPSADAYATYLYWLHFTNGTLQPALGRGMVLRRAGADEASPLMQAMADRQRLALGLVEAQLAEGEFLVGLQFTAADIIIMFTLTTMRYFLPVDLASYPAILAYIQRLAARPAYQAAMAKGDPGMELLLT